MMKLCEWCGEEFDSTHGQKFCGPQCKYEGAKQRQRERDRIKRQEQKVKRNNSKTNGVINIAVAARAAGMTYGEYVERVLNADKYKVQRRKVTKK